MRRFSFRREKRNEMKKEIEINGEMFEIIRSKYTPELIENHWKNYSGKTLDNFYQKPSEIKRLYTLIGANGQATLAFGRLK